MSSTILRTEPDGTIRVAKTRVTLDVLMNEYLNGSMPDEIVRNFDTLALSDVNQVIDYYLSHRTEVDTYLERRRVEAAELRRKIEAMPSYKPLTREMLQARLDAKRNSEDAE